MIIYAEFRHNGKKEDRVGLEYLEFFLQGEEKEIRVDWDESDWTYADGVTTCRLKGVSMNGEYADGKIALLHEKLNTVRFGIVSFEDDHKEIEFLGSNDFTFFDEPSRIGGTFVFMDAERDFPLSHNVNLTGYYWKAVLHHDKTPEDLEHAINVYLKGITDCTTFTPGKRFWLPVKKVIPYKRNHAILHNGDPATAYMYGDTLSYHCIGKAPSAFKKAMRYAVLGPITPGLIHEVEFISYGIAAKLIEHIPFDILMTSKDQEDLVTYIGSMLSSHPGDKKTCTTAVNIQWLSDGSVDLVWVLEYPCGLPEPDVARETNKFLRDVMVFAVKVKDWINERRLDSSDLQLVTMQVFINDIYYEEVYQNHEGIWTVDKEIEEWEKQQRRCKYDVC